MLHPTDFSSFIRTIVLALALLCAAVSGCSDNDSSGADGEGALYTGIVSPLMDMTVSEGEFLTFQADVSGGTEPYAFEWDFSGAAPKSAERSPAPVTFNTAGTYLVTFTVTDADDKTASDTVTITVNALDVDTSPDVHISFPLYTVRIYTGQSVKFEGTVSGGNRPFTRRWTFDGAAPDSTEEDPGKIAFADPGTYEVTFTVTDTDGDVGTDTITVKVQELAAAQWVSAAVGNDHTVAFKSDGSLWAWGRNNHGQLGTGSPCDECYSFTPQRVGSGTSWSAVSAGGDHTLALKADGTLWAWGDNQYGQIGTGGTTDVLIPSQIGADTDWAAVSAGAYYSMALKTDGALWAWGRNNRGQLGTGDQTDSLVPRQVGSDNNWGLIRAGGLHTVALKTDHSLWAWGYNNNGQLGTGTVNTSVSPVQVGTETDWSSAGVGELHTAALRSDGTLWAWGDNQYGQLGSGSSLEYLSPEQIGAEDDWACALPGLFSTMAIKTDGTLWAWGDNQYGQLGTGDTTDHSEPVQVGTSSGWSLLVRGSYHMLAVKSDGTLWAWGYNGFGQLGDGSIDDSYSPVEIK